MRVVSLIAIVFCGCVSTLPTEPTISADLAVEVARAVLQARGTTPDSKPAPKPGDPCPPCNGTGRLPTDGRVVVQCGACGGTGKVR
jgi:DnaJ-class molecular chaperone